MCCFDVRWSRLLTCPRFGNYPILHTHFYCPRLVLDYFFIHSSASYVSMILSNMFQVRGAVFSYPWSFQQNKHVALRFHTRPRKVPIQFDIISIHFSLDLLSITGHGLRCWNGVAIHVSLWRTECLSYEVKVNHQKQLSRLHPYQVLPHYRYNETCSRC